MTVAKTSFWQDLAWRFEALVYDAFVGLVRALPVDTASDVGGWLLRVIGPVSPTQKLVRQNIDLAFPDKDEAWKARVIRAQWDNLGRTFAEFAIMDRIRIGNGRVVVENMERLKAIAASDTPVVFISGHFANWEIMPSTIVDSGVQCQMTYRAANNPYVDERIKAGRMRYGVRLFAPKGGDGAKELLIAMGKGDSVALMNDQKFNRGVETPFFGRNVDTAPGPTRLAMRFGTVLQPMTVERLEKARFRVIVHDPIEVDNTGHKAQDIETTVAKVSAFIEQVVRERPEEWFWVHKRWPNAAYKPGTPKAP
ncbi:lysophospholipid acyltransferase family protein [Asticcacaulis sp. BYS171W]|uniref:Lysophospholipid acyltransferase family protein n=1 Tax=Asticcacaulis aquaticus TaxID=2984212 RepID=A0ABT5HNZ6_9CAUL|nr:lysophospholipid acyltransferase family protein [Asticcacaulis aquaticus]MDC7681783.1 lysophospholipid acyltransferase family protein [Asticcacaulis aquaticus]